jgi:hypothetical protein
LGMRELLVTQADAFCCGRHGHPLCRLEDYTQLSGLTRSIRQRFKTILDVLWRPETVDTASYHTDGKLELPIWYSWHG